MPQYLGPYDEENRLRVNVEKSTPPASSSPTFVSGSPVTLTERSGAIAAGGTSQQLAAANTARKYLLIQNLTSAAGQGIAVAENLYIRFGAVAAGIDNGTSIELSPGASLVFEDTAIPTQAIQVNATTINHRFIAVEG